MNYDMKSFPDCEEHRYDKSIVLKENQSKITLKNPKGLDILVITVDGCAIKEGLRCDYVVIPNLDSEIYIELKGRDISHAIKQLENSIKILSDDSKKKRKICFIISSRCPKMSTEIQKFKKNFKRDYNATLTIKNINYTHNV
ncbi:MAG: hypothetical protein F6K58_08995 [Symploca sp. SIO2E9]|nr:hypothetical protein [Symploca sp. SIO2E9]